MDSASSNQFNILRLMAATAVLVTHHFALFGLPEPAVLPGNSIGTIAVAIFFVISGDLVCKSWCADSNVWRFVSKRALRILPGLLLVVALSVFVLGPITTNYAVMDYFLDARTWQYFQNIVFKVTYILPGCFGSNPYPNAVNGSLWTLPLEVRWYGLVLLLGITGLIRSKYLLLALLLLLLVLVQSKGLPGHDTNINYFRYFGIFFLGGMILSSQTVDLRMVLIAFAVACIFYAANLWLFAVALLLPILTIYWGRQSSGVAALLNKCGDISYGVYIFSFPIQQTVVCFLRSSFTFTMCLCLSLILTYIAAFLSWHLIESRALGLKKFLHPM